MIIFLGKDYDLYNDFIYQTRYSKPDIIVSCQYPYVVPPSLLNTYTCVNIHYGKLPEYAGCNPIYWQLKNGEKQAGVTLHYMTDKLDAGDIISIGYVHTAGLTADELYKALSYKGLELLKKYYSKILDGSAPRKKQDLSRRKYYNKRDVDFSKEKELYKITENDIMALSFKGKQYPRVWVGSRWAEIRPL